MKGINRGQVPAKVWTKIDTCLTRNDIQKKLMVSGHTNSFDYTLAGMRKIFFVPKKKKKKKKAGTLPPKKGTKKKINYRAIVPLAFGNTEMFVG